MADMHGSPLRTVLPESLTLCYELLFILPVAFQSAADQPQIVSKMPFRQAVTTWEAEGGNPFERSKPQGSRARALRRCGEATIECWRRGASRGARE